MIESSSRNKRKNFQPRSISASNQLSEEEEEEDQLNNPSDKDMSDQDMSDQELTTQERDDEEDEDDDDLPVDLSQLSKSSPCIKRSSPCINPNMPKMAKVSRNDHDMSSSSSQSPPIQSVQSSPTIPSRSVHGQRHLNPECRTSSGTLERYQDAISGQEFRRQSQILESRISGHDLRSSVTKSGQISAQELWKREQEQPLLVDLIKSIFEMTNRSLKPNLSNNPSNGSKGSSSTSGFHLFQGPAPWIDPSFLKPSGKILFITFFLSLFSHFLFLLLLFSLFLSFDLSLSCFRAFYSHFILMFIFPLFF